MSRDPAFVRLMDRLYLAAIWVLVIMINVKTIHAPDAMPDAIGETPAEKVPADQG